MENQKINQQFRDDEIANIRRWDKEKNEYVSNPFPKIAGRLRLAHEANEALSIETEIIRYDEKIAVVVAVSTTSKGSFKGIGMASIERDQKLAHAILELAETRAIGRSLRFAGYGVEYCSAEEVSHLNGNGDGENTHHSRRNQNDNLPPKGNRNGDNLSAGGNRNGGSGSHNPGNGGNGSGSNGGNGNGNGGDNGNGNNRPSGSDGNGNSNGRLSAKQFQYLQKLNADIGRATADLDKQCLAKFGTVAQFLSKADASAMIEHMLAQ
jgi:hypothetical protein